MFIPILSIIFIVLLIIAFTSKDSNTGAILFFIMIVLAFLGGCAGFDC